MSFEASKWSFKAQLPTADSEISTSDPESWISEGGISSANLQRIASEGEISAKKTEI